MAWTQQGNIKGPKGDKGDQGTQGVPGEDGAGIQIAGTVATYAELPTGLGPTDSGKGYLVQADGLLYIWDGTQFPASGLGTAFRGPKGDTGTAGTNATVAVASTTTGAAGTNASVTNSGTASAVQLNFTIPRGNAGADGAAGNDGAPGAAGTKWFTGAGAPTTVPGSAINDLYLDTTTGDVYVLS